MKKSLVLAMAMALGVTASAYAANPFSDVPAGHWAYDSIDKLAAAGVIDGMGDGTYQGDKTMTRYEMAQIVAKAMAKGANVDKLAAEFADELDNLGVRVANLEKKADNVKITGAVNYYYKAGHNGYNAQSANDLTGVADREQNYLRTDLTISGKINEDWTYTALLRNEQRFDQGGAGKGEERVYFQRAWVDGRIGGAKVKAGRTNRNLADGAIWGNRMDGVEASYGKDVKVTVGYDQLASNNGFADEDKAKAANGTDAKVAFAEIDWKVNKALAFDADYYMFKDAGQGDKGDWNVINLGAKLNVTKNVKVAAQYLHADEGADKDGYVVGLNYKGANKAKVGSYGIYAKYLDLGNTLVLNNGGYSTAGVTSNDGYRAAMVGANYTFAKNIVGTVEYWNATLAKSAKSHKDEAVFMNLSFSF